MFCPRCGTQVLEAGAFCSMCGAHVGSVVSEPSMAPPPAPPSAPVPASADAEADVAPGVPAPLAPKAPAAIAQPMAGANVPYPKAPLGARFIAVLVDGMIAGALLPAGLILVIASLNSDDTPVLGLVLLALGGLWEVAYVLGRDALGGAGWGKRLSGLVVVSSTTGTVARGGATVTRQLVFYALNLIPIIGSFIEPILVLTDKEGRRLGDKAARTQVVRASEVASRGLSVPTGKGAAIAALLVAVLLSAVGGTVGGIMAARALADTSGMVSPVGLAPSPPAKTPLHEQAPTSAPAQPAEAHADSAVEGAVSAETAVDAVGNLLNDLKENQVDAARAHATRRFQEDESWFFAPAGGALVSFEVTDVYRDQALWVVEVSESWNSGPQKSRYFVIEEDNTPRVDDVDFLDQ